MGVNPWRGETALDAGKRFPQIAHLEHLEKCRVDQIVLANCAYGFYAVQIWARGNGNTGGVAPDLVRSKLQEVGDPVASGHP